MIKLITPALLLAGITIAQSVSGQILKLTPLTTFGTNGDGTLRPDEVDFLGSSNQVQRGMAWNPTTGNILIACRTNSASPGIERLIIVDGTYGTNKGTMDMSSLALGGNASFYLNLVGVADDGAVYAGNLSNQQVPPEYRLYRWDNETATMNIVWYGDPSGGIAPSVNRRWGDTFVVRGSGINTEVLIASHGTNVCIFKPTDSSMTTFAPYYIGTDVQMGVLGGGLTFGSGNTYWYSAGAGAGGPLYHVSYDINSATATTLQAFYYSNFSGTISPISVLVDSNWLAGIETRPGPDMVKIYDISDLGNPPVLQDRATWFTNKNNNTFSGALAMTTNNILYALDSDNGVTAYSIGTVGSNPLAPTITLSPSGTTVVISSNANFKAASDGGLPQGYQWQYKSSTNLSVTVNIPNATNTTFTITNAQLSNSGNYTFIASNSLGMATSSVALLNVVSAPQAVYDGFNYPVGGPLTGQQNPSSFYSWYLNAAGNGPGTIETGNLSYPGLVASSGNRFTWNNNSMSQRLPIGTNVSGTLYFSFLLQIGNVGSFTSSDTIAGLGQFPTDTAFSSKINITSNAFQSYQLGLYKGGGTTVGAVAPMSFSTNDIVFVVGNYTFNSGANNDDTCNLWLNPNPSTFGAATPPTPTVGPIGGTSGTDVAQLSYFFFRATTHPLKKIADELRIGYTWAEVTPQALPTLQVANTTTNTAVVSWPSYYGGDYLLQASTNVVTGPWANVANTVSVSGSNNIVIVSSTNVARFFRLLK